MTSLRLALSAVAVAFITFAASGQPLPFLSTGASAAQAAPLPRLPPAFDAEAAQTAARQAKLLPGALSSFDRQ